MDKYIYVIYSPKGEDIEKYRQIFEEIMLNIFSISNNKYSYGPHNNMSVNNVYIIVAPKDYNGDENFLLLVMS